MLFDKLLDFFKTENLYKNSDFKNTFSDNSFMNNTSDLTICSSQDELFLNQIINYWNINPYTHSEINYRSSTPKEKQDFALITMLSCFIKARSLEDFSPLILSELGISNLNHYINILLNKNFIQKAEIYDIIETNTIKDLKKIADSIGIKKSGKKSELVERIVNSLPLSEIEIIEQNSSLYTLSKYGKEKISGQEDYIQFHKYRYFISLAEFNDNRYPDGIHKRNFYDTMFHALCNRAYYYESNRDFDSLSMIYFHIYEILFDEFKHSDQSDSLDIALFYYAQYLYIQSCFCLQAHCAATYNLSMDPVPRFSLPSPNADAKKLSCYLNFLNFDAVFAAKPPSFFTHEEFIEYINDLLTDPEFDNEIWNKKIQNRMNIFFEIIKRYEN